MDFERLSHDLKQLRRLSAGLGLAALLLIGAQVLSGVVILQLLGRERTVLVPPNITQTFWVSSHAASNTYLEQMGSFVAWLVLDVTPASIDWKKDTLLSYVEPDLHGVLKARQEVEAERLKRLNASTAFAPQQLVPDETRQQVVVRGRLRTLINGEETANETKAYRVAFTFNGGRLQLTGFEEVANARP
ncbi:type IV conjugative transfer system protein TraE [Pseudomonas sp. 18175]|uniref:type IV conjugative transfer system protein TraE n=1 Tax=Pseudomonas sp. 18175 TaxID=3390056 RepID=UPI003D196215